MHTTIILNGVAPSWLLLTQCDPYSPSCTRRHEQPHGSPDLINGSCWSQSVLERVGWCSLHVVQVADRVWRACSLLETSKCWCTRTTGDIGDLYWPIWNAAGSSKRCRQCWMDAHHHNPKWRRTKSSTLDTV
ncbi:hypothetical protein BC831DRAFT_495807 [Entophlyctis helioformis]|nr:hypothetical protein BC831DRAFT_495807 [Entophlyctis helioformis]